MASADFCAAIGSPHGSPSPDSGTQHRPPRLSLTTFIARPPDLQPWPSMDGGLRCPLSTRPTSTAYYPIPVRRAATLLHASFRRRLTTTPLRFANPSPPSSWIRDLHPQVAKHAWQTKKRPDLRRDPAANSRTSEFGPTGQAQPHEAFQAAGRPARFPDQASSDSLAHFLAGGGGAGAGSSGAAGGAAGGASPSAAGAQQVAG